MAHPDIENTTGWICEPLFVLNQQARPVLTVVVKATLTIIPGGICTRTEEQVPLNPTGEYHGDPEISSMKYEPEVAFTKVATDVVMNATAHAPRPGTREMLVALRIGAMTKQAQIIGDRVWHRSAGAMVASTPIPFEKMPITWERAFGGWDRLDPDPQKHRFEPRNPVGVGFCKNTPPDGTVRLPNVESPTQRIQNFGETVTPTGFGFVSPNWMPRAAFAGTYDEVWQKTRSPLLPADFDLRYLSAASPGLVASGFLRGDESVVCAGVYPAGQLAFQLPGEPPPKVEVLRTDDNRHEIPMNLDTIVIEPDEVRVLLFWRGTHVLKTGPHDVRAILAKPS